MKLVVGLGNPGKKYESTRHNAGFWWVERLARGVEVELRSSARFHGRTAKLDRPHDIWLLLPDTYMNESGRAVAALANFYRIPPPEVLVVHDELDLLAGVARLKYGGGTAGHNGVTDVAAALGSREFWRLRIGIGHPRDSENPEQKGSDYVLDAPRRDEGRAIDEALTRSLGLWPLISEDKLEAAMLKLHTRSAGEMPDAQGN